MINITWADYSIYVLIALAVYYAFVFYKFWLPTFGQRNLQSGKAIENEIIEENEDFKDSDVNKFLRYGKNNEFEDKKNTTFDKGEIKSDVIISAPVLQSDFIDSADSDLQIDEDINEDFLGEDEYYNVDALNDNLDNQAVIEEIEIPSQDKFLSSEEVEEITSNDLFKSERDEVGDKEDEETPQHPQSFNIDFNKFLD